MTEAIVLGTGGHARSCLDVLATTNFVVRGCVGDPPGGPLQADYLGDDDLLPALLASGTTAAFVAVGDNRVRQRLTGQLHALGFGTPAAVSGRAIVSPTARIEAGTFVMHGATVGPYSVVGAGAIINTNASIDHDCTVGAFAHLGPGSTLAGTVEIGQGAFLGVGTSVIPETIVGAWCTVGAGSTVIGNVPEGTTVVGVPARPIRRKS